MADIALTAAQIEPLFAAQAEIYNFIAGGTITKGQAVYMDSAGKVQVADANAAGLQQAVGIALEGVVAGQAVSVLKRGHVAGFTLTSQAFDDGVYLSDTAGAVADAAGTLEVPVGRVTSLPQKGSITKCIYFDFRWREDRA